MGLDQGWTSPDVEEDAWRYANRLFVEAPVTELGQELWDRLRRMKRDGNGGWPAETGGKAPHKPLMLLAIMDLIEAGVNTENLVAYDERLLAAFDLYWQRCCGDRPTNPLQPFWYLKGDGFWTLVPQSGCKQALDAMAGSKVPARRGITRLLAGAQLNERLYSLMRSRGTEQSAA